MLIFSTKVDNKEYCWFKSTNVYYSEVDLTGRIIPLNESGVEGLSGKSVDVKIVFNRGACYLYKNVPIHDYIAFIQHLNRDDHESSGKAFNKFIKIYPCEKLNDVKLDDLQKTRDEYWKKSEIERTKKMDFQNKVHECFNKMINGNVTNNELIEWYGKDVFDEADILESEYFANLE
jgi:hypothetical protein